jgi:asparagine synthase (glutamine-hydrolysing)
VKTLAVMAGKWPKVNTNQIHRYLVNGFRSIYKKNITWFNDVQELPSSTNAIIYNPFKIIRSRYWELKYDPIDMSIDDAIAGIRERLVQSVKVRLRADVPIAFCLSGGVDSGTLASIASKEFQQKIHTFSIIDKDPRYNENTEINLVVRDLNCDHHAIKINQTRFFDNMENLITSHDAPVATISYYVHSLLSKMIHDYGYKVSISGVGADELFSGYYDHYSFWLAQMKMSSSSKFKSLLYDWQQLNMGFIRNPLLKDPMMFISNPNFRGHLYLNRSKFNSIMINPLEEDFFEEKYSGDLLRNRMLNELNHEIVPYILHEDDLNSMRYSIENRSPYLDRRLAEFAYNIPSKYLIKNGYSKWILRKSAKGYLTNDVRLYRQKKGFNASINSLIDLQDLDVIERLLSPSNIFNIVNKDLMKKMLLSNVSSNSMSKFIFSFISAKIFIDQHT